MIKPKIDNKANLQITKKGVINKSLNSSLIINEDMSIGSLNKMISKNQNIVNKIDSKGETLLSYAIQKKNIDACQFILNSKILDLAYQDKKGNSYLHLAIINKLEKVAKILIEKGINVKKKNNNGKTCLDLANSLNLTSIIDILKNKKEDYIIKKGNIKSEVDLMIKKTIDLLEEKNNVKKRKNNSKKKDTKNNSKKKDRKDRNSQNIIITSDFNTINNIKKSFNPIQNSKNNSRNDKKDLLLNIDSKMKTNNKNINVLQKEKNIQKNEKKKDKDLQTFYNFQKTDLGIKSKHKKFIKTNNTEKKLNEENNINNNKINSEKGNTSTETKFNSGTNKDKLSKTNNTDDYDKLYDELMLILYGEDDVFCNNKDIDHKLGMTSQLNNLLEKYPFININKLKDFQEDGEVNIKEAYERINKKYIEEIINNSKDNNGEDSNENDNEIISHIEDDEEYCVKFEDNKNCESSEEENEQNKSSLNILDNNILNENIISKHKTCKKNKNNPIRLRANSNKENNLMKNYKVNDFPKDIIKISKNKTFEQLSDDSSDNNNINSNNFENKKIYQIYPDKEEKYGHNLNNILNNNEKKDDNNKINIDDFKEPKLFAESIPKSINELEEDVIKNNILKEFLSQISLQKYINKFIENGFDDINLIIDQAQKGIYIKDSELKEAGISCPGDRAKILIRIQEKAGNFRFNVPKSVYYTCKNLNKIDNDVNINNLRNWLKKLRIDNYLTNFIENGYHSIELLLLQMESQCPLTTEILKEEIRVDKIGHRSRIINKLKEEGRIYINKLKTSVLLVGKSDNNKFCDCIIF